MRKTFAPDDSLVLFNRAGAPRYEKVARLLSFKDRDVAHATGASPSSIRLREHRIPAGASDQIRDWARALNLVARYFDGDARKTILWFTTANPLLGGISPRDMIRIGRFDRLYLFITDALADNRPPRDNDRDA